MMVAKVIPSSKFGNRSLYQKASIGEFPHFCNGSEKVHTMSEFAFCKLAVFLSGTICTA